MNQEKIGKFILELRKEKNMTQQELADKIGVTDRAISKWENGRGLPDLSLMKPLCDELGISINELISGEKIDKKEYQNKFEENVLNTINYSQKQIKRVRNKYAIITGIIVLFLITFGTLFGIDINRMRNNEPIFFSTWGFDYFPPVNLDEEKIINSIENYIVVNGDEHKKHDKSKTFASMRTFLIDEKEKNNLYYVYAWVLEECFYYEEGKIINESGSSIPYKFVVEKINEEFEVTDSRIPRDGSYYPKDIKNIFPRSVRKQIEDVHQDGTIKRLSLENQQKAEFYFNK